MEVVELTTEAEWREAYPVMHELRLDLDEDAYMTLLREMKPQGYRLMAVRDEGAIKALAGIAYLTNLYHRRHIWVYDLVTTASDRSRGYGAALMGHVEQMARELDCDTLSLASGLQRLDAHRFYKQRIGLEPTAYTFQKSLR